MVFQQFNKIDIDGISYYLILYAISSIINPFLYHVTKKMHQNKLILIVIHPSIFTYIYSINYLQNMQQIHTWYFVFGDQIKTSLSAEFARQNAFQFLQNPTVEEAKNHIHRNAIIEGPENLFSELEKIKPQLSIVHFGNKFENDNQAQLVREYALIGRCINISSFSYPDFRKAMYPNLVFVFGPINQQVEVAASAIAKNVGAQCCLIPENSNIFLSKFDKTQNYVLNGLFTNPNEIVILEEYFNIRVVHFVYEREDLPDNDEYFDNEYDLLPFLKTKPYYIPIKGLLHPASITQEVGKHLCPKLIYVNAKDSQQLKYAEDYASQTNGLILDINKINAINKRKNIPEVDFFPDKMRRLSKVIYNDLDRKEVILTNFPSTTDEFEIFENLNRSISYFVDMVSCQNFDFTETHTSQIYFLENQKRISPNTQNTLGEQLCEKKDYWLVNGPGTSGKTTVAKYIASEFNLQYLQFQPYAASIKQKISSPEDGEEVPVKKYIAHFASLIQGNKKSSYVIDGLPYTSNDLEQWIKAVGAPTVLNLRVDENEQIKRTRKKAQGDLAAEISQEESAKAKQNTQKNVEWIEKISELSPSSKIYQVDYNMPQLLSQPLLNSVLKPRIFLVQRNQKIIYQNIAIKYDMGFVNLDANPLRESENYVKKCGKRDVILCYYGKQSAHLVSEDLYWIEKHLGEIRYLGIWQPEDKQAKEQKMQLQKPVEEEKPKPAQGEEEQKEEEPEGEEKKKKFDIYEYEWTRPTIHKNLSQWFFKLKKTIVQRKNGPKEVYDKFRQTLDIINNERSNVYEVIS